MKWPSRRSEAGSAPITDTAPVLARIDLTLIANTCRPVSPPVVLPGVLTYIAEDPYTVALAIHSSDGHEVVEWHLARDLLADGLRRPAGIGDVRLRPVDGQLEVTLSSPCGAATLTTGRGPVVEFCLRTYALVARGCEGDWIDLDGITEALLEWEDF